MENITIKGGKVTIGDKIEITENHISKVVSGTDYTAKPIKTLYIEQEFKVGEVYEIKDVRFTWGKNYILVSIPGRLDKFQAPMVFQVDKKMVKKVK